MESHPQQPTSKILGNRQSRAGQVGGWDRKGPMLGHFYNNTKHFYNNKGIYVLRTCVLFPRKQSYGVLTSNTNELPVHAFEKGCWCAVSWLCTWWRQVAGAGAGCRCRCWVSGAGASAVSWLCTWWRLGAGAGCWWWVLAVHVVGTGCRVLVLGAGYRCWV